MLTYREDHVPEDNWIGLDHTETAFTQKRSEMFKRFWRSGFVCCFPAAVIVHAVSTNSVAVGINIPTLPFNFNYWAFKHTQTLPHIEGFLNTVVTRISSSHRGIHQLLLMQFHKQQNSLPLNRRIHLRLCLRAPSS